MEAHKGGVLLFIFPHLLITQFNKISKEYNVLGTVPGPGDAVVGKSDQDAVLLCFVVISGGLGIKLEKAQMRNYKL